MHKALQQLALSVAFVVLCPMMMWAQTDVVRYSATEYQDRGVVYYLPKSQLDIALRVVKTTVTPGEFSEYAPLLLGQKVATELAVSYEIESAEVRSLGVPDENYSYLVEFKAAQPYSYVALTKNGILSGINGYSTPLQEEVASPPFAPRQEGVDPLLPREFALATSRAKKAQIAANHLFSLREDLMSLLSGKAEFAPREGEAYTLAVSRLEGQIAAVERLFVGTTAREPFTRSWQSRSGSCMASYITCRGVPLFASRRALASLPRWSCPLLSLAHEFRSPIKSRRAKTTLLPSSLIRIRGLCLV